jgi:hypothetical protein
MEYFSLLKMCVDAGESQDEMLKLMNEIEWINQKREEQEMLVK